VPVDEGGQFPALGGPVFDGGDHRPEDGGRHGSDLEVASPGSHPGGENRSEELLGGPGLLVAAGPQGGDRQHQAEAVPDELGVGGVDV
jgi:hypothetical protein